MRQRAGEQRGKAGSAGDAGRPAADVEAGGRREYTKEHEQTSEAGERAGQDAAAHSTLNQTHSASVSAGTTVIREQRRTGSSGREK
jgi:hypothetical protein